MNGIHTQRNCVNCSITFQMHFKDSEERRSKAEFGGINLHCKHSNHLKRQDERTSPLATGSPNRIQRRQKEQKYRSVAGWLQREQEGGLAPPLYQCLGYPCPLWGSSSKSTPAHEPGYYETREREPVLLLSRASLGPASIPH